MATEVNESCYFVAVCDDVFPILVFVLVEPFRDDLLALLGESHDFLPDGAGSSRILLVDIVEHSHSGSSIAVISDALSQH